MKLLNENLRAGEYVFKVFAKDTQGLGREELVKFTVAERLNSGPSAFPAITPISFVAGSTGSVVLPATTHPKGFSLTYGLADALPVGFVFDATTRMLSWRLGAQP